MKSLPRAVRAEIVNVEPGDIHTYKVWLDNGRTVSVRAHPRLFTPAFEVLIGQQGVDMLTG